MKMPGTAPKKPAGALKRKSQSPDHALREAPVGTSATRGLPLQRTPPLGCRGERPCGEVLLASRGAHLPTIQPNDGAARNRG
jgi:hypothetical protein